MLEAVFSQSQARGTDMIIHESISVSSPVIKDHGSAVSIELAEATSYLSEPEHYVLPMITRVFTLPFGSTITDVNVHFSNPHETTLSKHIIHATPPIFFSNISEHTELVSSTDIDLSPDVYPSVDFTSIIGAGIQGDTHVIYCVVRCYPIHYVAAQNTLYTSELIDITVRYSPPASPMLFGNEYDLVVITPEKFSSELQDFIDHKNSHGVKTIIKTTETIYQEYQGRDKPEQIKYFIQNAIETWGIHYVLLIGNINLMPIRNSAVEWKAGDEVECNDVPTDLYYADVYDENSSFCSWDSNENGIYGEYTWDMIRAKYIDAVDLFADVNIGRIPCSNTKELQIVLQKIITYETQTTNQEWFKRLLLLGGDTAPSFEGNEGEMTNEYIAQTMQPYGFEPVKLWTSLGTFYPRFINQEWNTGAGFISCETHGFVKGFGTYMPNSDKRISYYSPYLLGVFNGEKLPIIFFGACLTSTLDYQRFGIALPCIAWSTLKKANGGSIATIGATRSGWFGVNGDQFLGVPYLHIRFFDAYEPGTTPSEMLTKAKNDYLINQWKDCVTLEEMTLLGDPSLKIGGYS